jgi:aspartate aminotransferase
MSISIIGKSITESGTLRLNEKAAILRAKGEPLIHLGGGEPQSKAPLEAITSFSGLLNTGEIRYTPVEGTVEMKQAIIRYTEEYYGRRVEPENVIASNGAKQSIMVALQSILDPQDEVVYPAPYWVSYPEMIKLCGAVPVPVYPEDGSFRPTMKDITQHVSSYTKAIILNSPNNPTGVVYSENFIKDIVRFCEEEDLYLILDDLYHRLVFDGVKVPNVYSFAKELDENSKIIVANGVSKQYAMTGFRIGWAVANKKLIILLQKAAIGAINGVQSCVDSLRFTLENNRNVMLDQLEAFDGVKATKPEGTFYVLVDFSYYDKDSTRLSNFLLDKVKVLTMPGIEFGLDGYLRLSTCGSIKGILEGIERIKWALDPNSPNELYIGERKLVRDWL